MTRVITILLALMTLSVLLTGCSGRQAEGNISTTPDGTVNGGTGSSTENNGSGSMTQDSGSGNTQPDSVVPGTDRNDSASQQPESSSGANGGMSDRPGESTGGMNDRPEGSVGSDMEQGFDDMVDGAKDAIDDMQDAIGEPAEGRARRSGTGMTGGR